MADLFADKPKIINVKFETEDEKELHAKLKADCAIRRVKINDRLIELIRDSVEQ